MEILFHFYISSLSYDKEHRSNISQTKL
jgi:hypothetical protein